MTIYPEWTEVSCPACKAGFHQPCTAIFTLPKGITLRNPHASRLLAYETHKIGTTNTATDSMQSTPVVFY